MRRGRLLGLLLLLVLILPVIAACGNTGDGAGTTGGTEATTAAGDTDATEAPAVEATEAPAVEATEAPAAETATTAAGAETATTATGAETTATTATAGAATTGGAATGAAAGGPDFASMEVEDGAELLVNTWGDPSEQAVNQASFDRFKELFPNVTINYQPVPSDFQTKLKADAAGGTLADVFYLDSSLMTAFAPNDILLDLTEPMQTAGVSQDAYLGELASIFVQDGKVYGLPKDFGALALFVNNDLAEAAGVDPASITTWDAWRDAAEKMTKEGVFGQCSDIDSQRSPALMLQNGVELVADNKANWNSPDAVEAMEFWYGLYRDKFATLKGDIGAGWCGEAFGKQQVAMAMEGGWLIPFMAKEYPDVTYTAIPIPQPDGGEQASLVFTNAWAAKADTQYPKAAAALVLYLTSAQNQKPIMETGFALPTVQSLLEDPFFESRPNEKVLAEAGSYGTPADNAFGGPAKKDDVLKPLGQAIERIFLGQGDVKTNLDQAAEEANQVLASD